MDNRSKKPDVSPGRAIRDKVEKKKALRPYAEMGNAVEEPR
jgi:hypothetical protein